MDEAMQCFFGIKGPAGRRWGDLMHTSPGLTHGLRPNDGFAHCLRERKAFGLSLKMRSGEVQQPLQPKALERSPRKLSEIWGRSRSCLTQASLKHDCDCDGAETCAVFRMFTVYMVFTHSPDQRAGDQKEETEVFHL